MGTNDADRFAVSFACKGAEVRSVGAPLKRIANLFRKRALERDLHEELQSNLQLQIEDNLRAGMQPHDARRAAFLRFGNLDAAKDAVRDARGVPFLETLGRDICFSFRLLRQNKAWSAVAILSLALGVGANTALFALVHNYALQKLPVQNPDQLITFRWHGGTNPRSLYSDDAYIEHAPGEAAGGGVSFDIFDHFRSENRTLTDIFAFANAANLKAVVDGNAEFATGHFVTGNFYSALGLEPALGRAITPEDDRESAAPVIVISHQYWQRRFSGDRNIVGSVLTINQVPFTVVGVLPSRAVDLTSRGTVNAPDVAIPLAFEPRVRTDSWLPYPQNWWLTVMGRLKPGVTASEVRANFNDVWQRTVLDGWNRYVATMPPEARSDPRLGGRAIRVPELRVVSASRGVSDPRRNIFGELAILGAIFGVVLLIVCVNLANLMLARAAGRGKEIALRLAIGASRYRLIRQLLTESIVLAFIGGAIGLLLATWCARLLSGVVFRLDRFSPYSYQPAQLNWPTLMFSVVLAVVVGLLFGMLPALRLTATGRSAALREHESRFSPSRTVGGKILLVAQVALSLLLLVTAGLLFRTLRNLERVNVGFDPRHLAVFSIQPGLNGYDRTQVASLYDEVQRQLLSVRGVQSVTFASPEGLLDFGQTNFDFWTIDPGAEPVHRVASVVSIHPNFFDTIGLPLKRGRVFTSSDVRNSPAVAIVNETLAKSLAPDGNPIGQFYAGSPNPRPGQQVEIVGVVADAKVNSLRDEPPPMFYRPIQQVAFPSRTVVIRTSGDPAALLPAIRDAVRQVDPDLPIRGLSTKMERIEGSYLMNERVFAFASSFFAVLALLIVNIGLFGLMSYSVARRTSEIGIRIALGAERKAVLKTVLLEAISIVVIGIAIGIAVVLAATRLIAGLLFGLATYDPLSIGAGALLMLTVSTIAAYWPARRASRVDPMIALRYE
jgi:predicted permease